MTKVTARMVGEPGAGLLAAATCCLAKLPLFACFLMLTAIVGLWVRSDRVGDWWWGPGISGPSDFRYVTITSNRGRMRLEFVHDRPRDEQDWIEASKSSGSFQAGCRFVAGHHEPAAPDLLEDLSDHGVLGTLGFWYERDCQRGMNTRGCTYRVFVPHFQLHHRAMYSST